MRLLFSLRVDVSEAFYELRPVNHKVLGCLSGAYLRVFVGLHDRVDIPNREPQ
jgi:hypothetical protein